MKKLCFSMLVAGVLWGCGKSGNTTLDDFTAPNTPAPSPQPAVATPSANPQQLPGKVDAKLSLLLKQFVQEKGRLPASFLEFAGAKTDSIPRPPEGYDYAIDAATTEVKLVKR